MQNNNLIDLFFNIYFIKMIRTPIAHTSGHFSKNVNTIKICSYIQK